MADTRKLPEGTPRDKGAHTTEAPVTDTVPDRSAAFDAAEAERDDAVEGSQIQIAVDVSELAAGAPSGTRRLPAGTPRIAGTRTQRRGVGSESTFVALHRKVGRYRVCAEIASGGMAAVYVARLDAQRGFEKIVALKCIHDHMAREESFVEMFLDEARVASQVSHPNVCHIFDFGKADASYYIAMEYLVGETLSAVRRARWERRRDVVVPHHRLVTRILADACEGLHAVHELEDARGRALHVVHRDVSPANLMVTYDGSVKLMDFGIARAKHQSHRTQTGEVRGTIAYMAPEQIRSAEVDRRADIWALGAVGWELLTGHSLFRRESSVKTMYAVLNESIPRVDVIQPTVPRALADVMAHALKRDPEERFATARDFLRALQEAAVSDGGLLASADVAEWLEALFPDGRERHAALLRFANEVADRPLRSRRRWLAAAAATLMLGAGGVAAGRLVIDGRHQAHEPPAAPRETEAPPATAATSDAIVADPDDAIRENADPMELEPEPGVTALDDEEAPAPEELRDRGTETEAASDEEHLRSRPVARRGQVSVSSPDTWATVYERGRRLGQTPLQATLPAGNHVLEVRPHDRAPGRRVQVRVQPRGVSPVVVRFRTDGDR